jgi:hypothetical protein
VLWQHLRPDTSGQSPLSVCVTWRQTRAGVPPIAGTETAHSFERVSIPGDDTAWIVHHVHS